MCVCVLRVCCMCVCLSKFRLTCFYPRYEISDFNILKCVVRAYDLRPGTGTSRLPNYRAQYSQDNIQAAVTAVKAGMSLRDAEQKYQAVIHNKFIILNLFLDLKK